MNCQAVLDGSRIKVGQRPARPAPCHSHKEMTVSQKHTPGPYFACSADGGNAINIECKGDGNDSFPIATLKGPDRKANGALFAAAPDMLEVLQTILKRGWGMNIKQASLSDLANELDRADIALAVGFSRKVERQWK